MQVPHEVVLLQEVPPRESEARARATVRRIAETPVVLYVDREEAIECHRQDHRASELLGEDYSRCGLGDKVREWLQNAVT